MNDLFSMKKDMKNQAYRSSNWTKRKGRDLHRKIIGRATKIFITKARAPLKMSDNESVKIANQNLTDGQMDSPCLEEASENESIDSNKSEESYKSSEDTDSDSSQDDDEESESESEPEEVKKIKYFKSGIIGIVIIVLFYFGLYLIIAFNKRATESVGEQFVL